MDRRQVCAQVLQSSLLPQAIGFIYPGIKDTHLPPQAIDFYRHKRLKTETAILPPQAIRPWNAAPATQKQQSPAAVKKNHLWQQKMNVLTATSDWGILPPQAKYEPFHKLPPSVSGTPN